MKEAIWIDSDLAVGKKRLKREGYCDVDDGFAIWQLMHAEGVEIRGISAVFGNTPLADAYELCQEMSQQFAGGRIPVYRGAAEALKLNEVSTNQAVEALAAALRKEKLRVMAIGPATNIGLLLLKYPELAGQLSEVVLVAGRRSASDHFEIGDQGGLAPDLNFDLDNDAFRVMMEAGVRLVLCPFEISHKVWITKDDLAQLATGSDAAQWLAEHSEPWLKQWEVQGAEGFNPFDVLASHYMLYPEDIIFEELNAHLEIHPNDLVKPNDREAFKQYLVCDQSPGYSLRYCYDVVDDFHSKLLKSLL